MSVLLTYIPLRSLALLVLIINNSPYASYGEEKPGFYCNDAKIMKQYTGDTVHITYLFGVILIIFPMFIYISEKFSMGEKGPDSSFFGLHSKYYLSGVVYCLTGVDLLKVLFTELRPHFFYTCLPDMKNINCSQGLITVFNCTGEGESWLLERDIYRSFPSGHAAVSAFAFLYICIHLYTKKLNLYKRRHLCWSIVVILLTVFFAGLCGISRIIDNRHHWWDVVIGAMLGLLTAFIAITLSVKVEKKQKIL